MLKMKQIGFLLFAIGVLSTPAWAAVPGESAMDPISIDNNSYTLALDVNSNPSENPATAQGAMKKDGAPVLLAHGGGGGGSGAGAGGGDGAGDCGGAGGASGGESGAGSCGCGGSGADGAGASGNGTAGGNGANSGQNGPGADSNQM